MTSTTPLDDVKLYTVPQVAAMFNMDMRTIRDMARQGRLHGIQIGRRLYITRTSVEKLLAD